MLPSDSELCLIGSVAVGIMRAFVKLFVTDMC